MKKRNVEIRLNQKYKDHRIEVLREYLQQLPEFENFNVRIIIVNSDVRIKVKGGNMSLMEDILYYMGEVDWE